MAKLTLKSEDLKRFYTYTAPLNTVLVTACDEKGKPNIITLAWHCPISIDPPMYGISMHPKRYTHELITKTGEFVINFPPFRLLDKVHYCGSVSGRREDKFRKTGFTMINSQFVKPPAIAECYLALECKLAEGAVFGDHTFFAGNVVAAVADENAFEEGIIGKECDPTLYLGTDMYLSIKSGRRKMQMK